MTVIPAIKKSGAIFIPSALVDFLSGKLLKYANAKDAVILNFTCSDGL
jgi:hypothetical protein